MEGQAQRARPPRSKNGRQPFAGCSAFRFLGLRLPIESLRLVDLHVVVDVPLIRIGVIGATETVKATPNAG